MGSLITRGCSGNESFKNTSSHKGPKEHEDELTMSIVRELNAQRASSQHLKDGYKQGLEILTNTKLEGTIFENGLKKLMSEEEIQLFLYELEVHSGVDALYGIPLRIETARRGHELWWKIGNVDATVWKQVDTNLRDLCMTTNTWSCNIFAIRELTQRPIAYVGYQMFRKYGFIEEYNIPEQQLINFFDVMEHGYNMNQNPYHNSTHSADVLQSCTVLLDLALKIYDLRTSDVFALCIACIIHDYAHPGFTNAYLKVFYEESQPLSVGVLENFHSLCGLKIINTPECNILVNADPSSRKKLISKIRDLVLFTDLARHFPFVGSWHETQLSQRKVTDYESRIGLSPEETIDLLRILIKSSDLANAAKPWDLYDQWANAIMEEFFLQGDTEREGGAAISMFMNREQPEKSTCQFGFLSKIVGPLLEILFQVIPESKLELNNNFTNNLTIHTPGN